MNEEPILPIELRETKAAASITEKSKTDNHTTQNSLDEMKKIMSNIKIALNNEPIDISLIKSLTESAESICANASDNKIKDKLEGILKSIKGVLEKAQSKSEREESKVSANTMINKINEPEKFENEKANEELSNINNNIETSLKSSDRNMESVFLEVEKAKEHSHLVDKDSNVKKHYEKLYILTGDDFFADSLKIQRNTMKYIASGVNSEQADLYRQYSEIFGDLAEIHQSYAEEKKKYFEKKSNQPDQSKPEVVAKKIQETLEQNSQPIRVNESAQLSPSKTINVLGVSKNNSRSNSL